MHPIKKLGLITTIATIGAALAAPLAAFAYDATNTGLNSTGSAAGINTATGQLPIIIGTVISAALGLVGVIFLILMVYSGFMWMIARGDEGKVEKSKETMINAIIGIVIVVAAYAITSYIVQYVSKPATTTAPASGSQTTGGTST